MDKKTLYFSARKREEKIKRSKKFVELIQEFWSKIWYVYFIFPFLVLHKKFSKSKRVLKFDVWEESSFKEAELRHLPFLIKKFFDPEQIFFIDIDKKLIKNAKNNINYFRFKKAFFLNADVAAMPFKKNTFDLIVDFSTIDHINNENMKNAFEEIYRTLQKDKYLIIFHLNSEYFNIKRWNAIYKKQNKFPSFYRSIDNLLQIVGKKIKPIEKGYCMPFFSDATLSIHYKFLFNKFYKILPKKFLFSAFNSPKLNLFFYLIGKK